MNAAKRSTATTDRTGNVAVIGGGIAGMAAAAAFAQAGAAVRVLEQAPEITEIGAGLQISPNGGAVLEALGLGAEAEARGIRAQAVEPRDALSGRVIGRFDLTGQGPVPYRFFHRADLLDMLAGAAARAGAQVATGAHVDHVSPEGMVDALPARLVVGADGIHSVARAALNPESRPFFTEQVAWRALVAADHPPVARIWMAPHRHVVSYPLPGGRVNLVAVQERRDWAAEGWNHADDPANLRAAFADCAPELRAMLERVGAVRLWGLFRHPVAARWHGDALALVGDAAHPTLPFLGQGANLALEDGWVLAALAARAGDLPAALARYQAARAARVRRALATANANARNYHLSGPARRLAHLGLAAIARLTPGALLGRLAWLYRHDVTAEFPAAPLSPR
ncbi:MAG: FAD-dependent monooxygenase [Rubellimicrobium sp.]|nr:FAD-dependent monooxygenase [Rubellimicrobium sp.]